MRSSRSLSASIGLGFVALAVLRTLTWEPVHDEGVTFFQAVAPLDLARYAESPLPMRELARELDGGGEHGVTGVLRMLRDHGMHPPAWYLALNGWVRVFGSHPLVLRTPALLLGLLSLLGVAGLARRVLPAASAGAWAAALLATSPWFVELGVLLRPYAAALCLAVWSTVWALDLGTAPQPTAWWQRARFVAISALGLYTLYHHAFLLAWQLLLIAAARRDIARTAATGAAVALLFAPWLPVLAAHLSLTGGAEWYFNAPLGFAGWIGALVSMLGSFALGAANPPATAIAVALAGVAALALGGGLATLGSGGLSPDTRRFWLLAPALPTAIALADRWHGSHTLLVQKISFGVFLLLLLVVAAGAARRRGPLLLAAVVLLQAGVCLQTAFEAHRNVSDFERIAARVSAADHPDHVVALSSPVRGYAIPLLLVLKDAGITRARIAAVPGDRLAGLSAPELTLVRFPVRYADAAGWSDAQLQGLSVEPASVRFFGN